MSTRPFIARTWSHAIRGASSTPSRSGVAAFAELRKATTPILQSSRRDISTDSLPAIIRPSFWRSITPKFLRSGSAIREAQTPVKKEWNPATFFIIIFLLIGSQAIQIIALHRSYDNFSNQTEAKLALLREVVRRVQAGEEFDVKAALGTGNKAKEKEWEQVMRELEEEDNLYAARRKKRREALNGTGSDTTSASTDGLKMDQP